MDLGLKGKRALIGGASSGIGLAIAEGLAAEGCDIVLWSRRTDALERVAEDIRRRLGVRVGLVAADARDDDAAKRVADAAVEQLGGIDIVVLNAGGPPPGSSMSTTQDEWRTTFQMLALTPIDVATRLLEGMTERRWGRILAVLSSGIRQPIPELAYSNGGRLALVGWLKTLATAAAPHGITVNGLVPGRIATPRAAQLEEARAIREDRPVDDVRLERQKEIPAGRYGTAEEVAAVATFLASERSTYVTGAFVPIDGGLIRSI